MKESLEILMNEHRVIEQVVAIANQLSDRYGVPRADLPA
jgi:hypothetical protein